MIAAARSTWLLLRRPGLILAGAGAVLLFSIAVTSATFLTAARPGGSRLGAEPLYLSDLEGAGIPAELIGRILMITGAVAMSVAAAHVGGVFQGGLVRTVFVRQPRRARWLLGTWAALCIATAGLTAVGALAVTATAVVLAPGYGVSTEQWATGEAVAAAAVRTAGIALALLGFTSAGILLAVLTRSSVVAIGIGLAYGLFEGVLAALLGPAGRSLPGQVLAIASRGSADPGFAAASVIAVALIAACITTAAIVLRARDVTD